MSVLTRTKSPNRLRELREARGLSQTELADQINMKQPTVNRHENMNRSLDGFSIERYAKFYGVYPFQIFYTVDEVESESDEDVTR